MKHYYFFLRARGRESDIFRRPFCGAPRDAASSSGSGAPLRKASSSRTNSAKLTWDHQYPWAATARAKGLRTVAITKSVGPTA